MNAHTVSPIQRYEERGIVMSSRQLSPGVYHLTLQAPSIASHGVPGQFVMLTVNAGYEPLLRRPMSLLGADPATGNIDILYRVVGAGTALLADLQEGDSQDIIGPLGCGFQGDGAYDTAVLIGGGMGIPPLVFLAPALLSLGKTVHFFYGARSESEVYFRDTLTASGVTLHVATDDGSLGHHGFITERWSAALTGNALGHRCRMFSCGPPGMLLRIIDTSRQLSLDTQVSLETQMPCGLGLCQGCAIPVKSDAVDGFEYRLACRYGPVLQSSELMMERFRDTLL